jgi:hypothetical protein
MRGGWCVCAALAGCAHAAAPPAQLPFEPGVVLVVDNTTTQPLAVYFIEKHTHTRLGEVAPQTLGRLPVRASLLNGRMAFRVYAFRGVEGCPVARVVDSRLSMTPRISVTAGDTIVSSYLPGDACRLKAAPR